MDESLKKEDHRCRLGEDGCRQNLCWSVLVLVGGVVEVERMEKAMVAADRRM